MSAEARAKCRIVDADGKPIDDATYAYIFQPMSPELFDDPICGEELRRLAREDPDIIAAVEDVDRTIIRDDLKATPAQRLRSAEENVNFARSCRAA